MIDSVTASRWNINNTYDVILEVLSNTRKFNIDRNTGSGENVAWTDTAQLQDVWTTNSATCDNYLLVNLDGADSRVPIVGILHSGSLGARGRIREDNLGDRRVCQDREIGSIGKRVDVAGPSI